MLERVLAVGLIAVGAVACTVEHRTVVVAAEDACTRYGFTASSGDYVRCQQLIAEQRRAGRVAVTYSNAQIVADSQVACASYGVPRDSAQFDRCVQDEFAARRPG
jgi:hypothetical protein